MRELLKMTAAAGASDLFVTAEKIPSQRLVGQILPSAKEMVSAELIEKFRKELLSEKAEAEYSVRGAYDFGFTLPGSGRFRINFFVRQGLPAFIARAVPSGNQLSFEELHLPPVMAELSSCRRGLVLIAGTAGSGKTTTMAAMLNNINKSSSRHVLTIEDPIEFIHRDESCLITQREVGSDTPNFADALRSAVRESPDVLVIGEMRDLETMRAALDAALTGHLVLSTIHTADTIQVIERIINHFPEHLRAQTAEDLASCIQGIVAQRLVPSVDGTGLFRFRFLSPIPYCQPQLQGA